jgi:hypothetical protein
MFSSEEIIQFFNTLFILKSLNRRSRDLSERGRNVLLGPGDLLVTGDILFGKLYIKFYNSEKCLPFY